MNIFENTGQTQSMKSEGYGSVWNSFVTALHDSNDLDTDLPNIMKEAAQIFNSIEGNDSFSQGQQDALRYILDLESDHLDWLLQVKLASDAIKTGHEKSEVLVMMKEASMHAVTDIERSDDLHELMLQGPSMTSFELGKYAALIDLSHIIENGFVPCVEAVNATLNSPFGS